ncbi:MAG: hypothetical protein KTR26_06020 [Flammeovirgaceae bacterium]|nr:hypothetical protein [Flammeovirgaceae bacterium]
MVSKKILILFILLFPASIVFAQEYSFNDANWEFSDEYAVEDYKGQESLNLKKGYAKLKNTTFENGIIEVDIAIPNNRSFPGVGFRVVDEQNFEEFYVRPHQSGNPDATQYTPVFNGLAGWQLYHGDGYSGQIVFDFDEWMHLKIVISGQKGEVYLKDMEKPFLVIHQLKRDQIKGGIAFIAPARFANLKIIPNDSPALKGEFNAIPVPEDGTITEWSVSSEFDEKLLANLTEMKEEFSQKFDWTILNCENSGLANVAKISQIGEGSNSVLVKQNISSTTDQIKALKIGFSDRVKFYCNGQVLFSGQDGFRSRDYRYLGTIGYFDTVYLPLKKGNNEIVIALSESFGGWGIKAKFENMDGIKIKEN